MTNAHYTVIFEHGDRPNQWLAHVKEIPECHTFGRGLAQTRARIREALELWEGAKGETADLIEILPLPKATRKRIATIDSLLAEMDRLAAATKLHRKHVIASLRKGWSMRDISHVLQLSHQRIGQVAGRRSQR